MATRAKILNEEAERMGLPEQHRTHTRLAAEVARAWQEENAAALAASNAWVEEHGLPLARHQPG